MNPFFFGTSARQLFGIYESPQGSVRGGVVLCHPIGEEYLYAYPTMRLFSRMLADAGYHVLRFDYFGTGDSGGEFEGTVPQDWLDDIGTALAELKDLSQLPRVGLVGMRYGATLAALAARDRRDTDQLVLIDPVWGALPFTDRPDRRRNGTGSMDIGGVVLTDRARSEVERITLDTLEPPLPRMLAVATTPAPDHIWNLNERLKEAGVDSSFMHSPDLPAWRNAHITAAGMPVATLRQIVTWMS